MSSLDNFLVNSSCNCASDFSILKNTKEFNRVVFATNKHPNVLSTFQQLMTSDMQAVHWVYCDILAKEYSVQVRYCTMRTKNRSENMNCFRSAVMIGLSDPYEDDVARATGVKPFIYAVKIFGSGQMQIFGLPTDNPTARFRLYSLVDLLKRLNTKLNFTLEIDLCFEQRNIGVRTCIPKTIDSPYIKNGILDIVSLNADLYDRLARTKRSSDSVKIWSPPERETVTQYCQLVRGHRDGSDWKVHLSLYCSGALLVFGPDVRLHYRVLREVDALLCPSPTAEGPNQSQDPRHVSDTENSC